MTVLSFQYLTLLQKRKRWGPPSQKFFKSGRATRDI
jgi:hypothetical protein